MIFCGARQSGCTFFDVPVKEGKKKTSVKYNKLCRISLYPDRKARHIGALHKHYNKLYAGVVKLNSINP